VVDGVTTYYIGNHYELKNSVVTKYYFAGTTRLAVRTNGTLSYLLGDHIGRRWVEPVETSSVTTDANGVKTASALYCEAPRSEAERAKPSVRRGTRSVSARSARTTSFAKHPVAKRSGHRSAGGGQPRHLLLQRALAAKRPSLGRFTQPDTIVPTSTQGTQAWDRYAFVNNNPVRFNDPTGHKAEENLDEAIHCNDPAADNNGEIGQCKYSHTQCGVRGQYSPDCPGWHNYTTVNVVCPAELHCTLEQVADAFYRFAFPGQNPSKPVEDGKRYSVAPFGEFPEGSDEYKEGEIITRVYGMTTENITEPSHIFYDGVIYRTLSQDRAGNWVVTTHGYGNNLKPGMKEVNLTFGPDIFNFVDQQMSEYIENQ